MKLLGSFEPFEAANISASSSSREREREIKRETQSEREKRKKERKRERESRPLLKYSICIKGLHTYLHTDPLLTKST